mgnify:CR=1 FL=1
MSSSSREMRQVEICGSSVTVIKVPVSASLRDITARVAKACRVQEDFVKMSVDGRRATDLLQVSEGLLLRQLALCTPLLRPVAKLLCSLRCTSFVYTQFR